MSSSSAQTEPKKLTLHLIGHGHLDPVWLWRWPEGYAEAKATFQSALDRMDETPGFIFTCSSAAVYEWVEENDPAMFRKIAQRVKEGRWAVAGGWWIESDLNIPNGESLVRQALYGQRYFREKFGVSCRVGFSPDSFGHSAQLPKILAGCGFEGYLYMRPSDSENPRVPLPVYRWIADDGSSVICLRLVWSYSAASPENLEFKMKRVPEIVKDTPFADEIYIFYGVGNHGGGPTKAQLALIESWKKDPDKARLLYSSPERFLEVAKRRGLPEWREEMQGHALGCLSIANDIKSASRRAEEALLSAEMWTSAAQMLTGKDAPTKKLARAWKDLLFNHFHDILPGSSVKEAYIDARDQIGGAIHQANYALTSALSTISSRIDTRGEGQPLVVFNHHPFEFEGVIETDDVGFELWNATAVLKNHAGEIIPHQLVKPHTMCGRVRIAAHVKIPSLGYQVLRLHKSQTPPPQHDIPGAVAVQEKRIQNEYLQISLDADGHLSVTELSSGRVIFSGPGALPLVIEDKSDTWSHRVPSFPDVIGKFEFVSAEVIESGPVRGRLRARYRYNESTLRLDFTLGMRERFVTIDARIDWRERWKMLKLSFPTVCSAGMSTAEVPYGIAHHPNDAAERPMQQWVDLSAGDRGVAIANAARYAYSAADGEIRITVLRSPPYAYDENQPIDFDAEQEFMEQGISEFKLAIIPHQGDWRHAGVLQTSRFLNRPPMLLADTFHDGAMKPSGSFVSVAGAGVYIGTIKRAEDGGGWIIRAAEWFGEKVNAIFNFPALRREFQANFEPWQIKCFLVADEGNQTVREVNLIEDLPRS